MAPTTKPKTSKGRFGSGPAITDSRFSSIQTDPRFRLPSKKNARVQLDRRFAHMLKDDDFSKKATVDKYGRRLPKKSGAKELKRLYKLEDKEESDDPDDDDEVQKELRRAQKHYDPARDGGFDESSSSEEESSDEDEEADEEIEEAELPGQQGEVEMGEVSSRIAVVNLDWENIRSIDLMAVASSFAPSDGRILNVSIYPSEFGKERMEREQLEGPPKEIFSSRKRKDEDEEEDSDDEEERIKERLLEEQEGTGADYDSSALRNYQLSRLRYYYAVITCSSDAVAKKIYDDMDGREYLTSANFFDLRFIPEEVSFDSDKPRDTCSKVSDDYKPNEFITDALRHSNVKLTWDADDNVRKEAQKRAFSRQEMEENDLQAYIGSDESGDEEAEDDGGVPLPVGGDENAATPQDEKTQKAASLRAALGLGSAPAKSKATKVERPVGGMQVTFSSAFSEPQNGGSVFENEPEETTVEKYMRKEKERKEKKAARRRAKRQGKSAADGEEENSSGDEIGGNGDAPQNGEDLGFDDPFFNDPEGAEDNSSKTTKTKKQAKAERKKEEEVDEAAAKAERDQLELLMLDDKARDDGTAVGVRHFDMKEIEKAEKAARKKGRKGKKDRNVPGTVMEDIPAVDTSDPRFSNMFESHEFAIDPTNPKFKGTQAMKQLLEEGRKKRKAGGDDEDGPGEVNKKKKAKAAGEDGVGGVDVKQLLARVKGKTVKAH